MTEIVTTFPRGETVVGMVEFKGHLVVATTHRVYINDHMDRLKPLEVSASSEEPAPVETQVWGGVE